MSVRPSTTYQNGVKLDFIRRGKPCENGFIESFNGRLGTITKSRANRLTHGVRLKMNGFVAGVGDSSGGTFE